MRELYSLYTDVGGRENNEDALCVLKKKNELLFVVADGLGGYNGGEMASALALEILKKAWQTADFDAQSAILQANEAILSWQKETGLSSRTTICLAHLTEKVTTFAHVGDSRIYAFLGQKILYQSTDHSVAQMAVLTGEIDQSEVRNHPDRNVLTRCLGSREDVKVDISTLITGTYDALLLCSDGFWEILTEEDLLRLKASAESAEDWLNQLRALHESKKGPDCDNNTAIILLS